MSNPQATVQVKVSQATKARLEMEAAKAGVNLGDYIRANYKRLLAKNEVYPINAGLPQDFVTIPLGSPAMGTPYMGMGGSYTDVIDKFVNDVGKMALAKMFMQMFQGELNPQQVLRAARSNGGSGGGSGMDDLSIGDIVKLKMLGNDNSSKMNELMLQFVTSRQQGDSKGADNALQMMVALMANQSQQQQLTQQAQMQNAQLAQQAQNQLFTAALGSNKANSEEARRAEQQSNDRYTSLMQMMFTNQNALTQQMFQNQIAQQAQMAQLELARIKEGNKSPLEQLNAIVDMRNSSPVYAAAFNAALGIKEGDSMVGKIFPMLKDLGVDKALQKIGGALAGMVIKPQVPQPPQTALGGGIPPPGMTFPPPSPLGQTTLPFNPVNNPLESLKLPEPQSQQPQSAQAIPSFSSPAQKPVSVQKTEKPAETEQSDAVGYTNLNSPTSEEEETP